MAKVIKYAALAVLAASSAEAFTGSAFTGVTPKLRNTAVATRAAKSHGPDMSLVLVTGARCFTVQSFHVSVWTCSRSRFCNHVHVSDRNAA